MATRRRRKKKLPEGLFDAHISGISHDGRGIAHLDGKVTFIDGALPDEQVRFEYTYQRKQFDEGSAREIGQASEDRVSPPCVHVGICGGCSLQHISGQAQIRYKQQALVEQLQQTGIANPVLMEPMTGPLLAYRRKARLAVKYVRKKGKVLVGFREKRNSFIADIEQCEILVEEVGHKLDLIASLIGNLETREQIPQIEIAKGDEPEVALVFRHLVPLPEEDIAKLKVFCRENGFMLYLQSEGPESVQRIPLEDGADDEVIGLQYYLPDFRAADKSLKYVFHPCDFTQINASINRQMVERVISLLNPGPDDTILDLFCGLGNFSLALASKGAQVVGVEGSETMVERAETNARLNSLGNTMFHALNLEQDLVSLKSDQSSWVNREFNKMLIDPPRSGALEVVSNIGLFSKLEMLVYVSCNPSTLVRDIGILSEKGFVLEQIGVMDMFPHTNHVESLALLIRK